MVAVTVSVDKDNYGPVSFSRGADGVSDKLCVFPPLRQLAGLVEE